MSREKLDPGSASLYYMVQSLVEYFLCLQYKSRGRHILLGDPPHRMCRSKSRHRRREHVINWSTDCQVTSVGGIINNASRPASLFAFNSQLAAIYHRNSYATRLP